MNPAASPDITRYLEAAGRGDPEAEAQLLRSIYAELRALAESLMGRERTDHTLQPTALVHEAYLRLMGDRKASWENRAHFFASAAQAMRRVLVEHARKHDAVKRGGGRKQRVELDPIDGNAQYGLDDLLAIDEALTKLIGRDPQKGRIVELRFYGGLSVEETAAVLDLSPRTVKRGWSFAKACLAREIGAT